MVVEAFDEEMWHWDVELSDVPKIEVDASNRESANQMVMNELTKNELFHIKCFLSEIKKFALFS